MMEVAVTLEDCPTFSVVRWPQINLVKVEILRFGFLKNRARNRNLKVGERVDLGRAEKVFEAAVLKGQLEYLIFQFHDALALLLNHHFVIDLIRCVDRSIRFDGSGIFFRWSAAGVGDCVVVFDVEIRWWSCWWFRWDYWYFVAEAWENTFGGGSGLHVLRLIRWRRWCFDDDCWCFIRLHCLFKFIDVPTMLPRGRFDYARWIRDCDNWLGFGCGRLGGSDVELGNINWYCEENRAEVGSEFWKNRGCFFIAQ